MDTKKPPTKVLELAAALTTARQSAEAIPIEDLKGTGNSDSAEIVLKRWRRDDVEAAAKLAGLSCYKRSAGRWHFHGWDAWQGLNETKKVIAFVESMNTQGFAARTYCVMD